MPTLTILPPGAEVVVQGTGSAVGTIMHVEVHPNGHVLYHVMWINGGSPVARNLQRSQIEPRVDQPSMQIGFHGPSDEE